jgi:hypothetical protein
MGRRPSTLVVALALAGTALAATACGTGSGTAQVVGTAPGGAHAAVAPHTTMQVAPPTTTATPGGITPTSSPTGGTTPTTQPVAPPVSPAAINQLNTDLGSLGQSLNQVDNDLAQAQGDQ